MVSFTYNPTQEKRNLMTESETYSDILERYQVARESETEAERILEELNLAIEDPGNNQETKSKLLSEITQCKNVSEIITDDLEFLAEIITDTLTKKTLEQNYTQN